MGAHEIQKDLNLSSPSLAHYHLRKLVEDGLVREESGGYVVDRLLFENMIRIKGSIIPFQTTFLSLFCSTLAILLFFFRPQVLSAEFIFSVMVNSAAVCIFASEVRSALRSSRLT